MKKVFAFGILVAAVAGGAWLVSNRAQALRHCRAAGALEPSSRQLLTWIREAGKDPFALAILRQDPVRRLGLSLKARAADVLTAKPQWMLGSAEQAKFRALAEASLEDASSLSSALETVQTAQFSEKCRGEDDAQLNQLAAQGQAYWDSRHAQIYLAKISFGRDKEIFCRDRALQEKLEALLKASEAACSSGKRRTPCRPGSFQAMKKEIADLDSRRALNLEKMKKKWPLPVLNEVPCQ